MVILSIITVGMVYTAQGINIDERTWCQETLEGGWVDQCLKHTVPPGNYFWAYLFVGAIFIGGLVVLTIEPLDLREKKENE